MCHHNHRLIFASAESLNHFLYPSTILSIQAMKRFIQAWKDGYDETGTSWDDSNNNRVFNTSDELIGVVVGVQSMAATDFILI